MYEEKELNRQRIFTTGLVEVTDGKAVMVVGDCICKAFDTLVYAFDQTNVEARGSSRVFGYGHATILATSRSKISARDYCRVTAEDIAIVRAYDNSEVTASDQTRINAIGNTDLTISGDSIARVMGTNATVKAFGFATVHHDGLVHLTVEGCAVAVDVKKNKTTIGGGLQVSMPE